MSNPTRTPRVTYEQARALVMLDQLRSYEKVKERLGLGSTSPLIHVMRRMATTLGSKPLVRATGDTVVVTSEGKRYLELAKGLKQACEAFDQPTKVLRVTAYPSHAGAYANSIARFANDNGNSRIEYYEVTDEHRRDQGARMLRLLADGITDIVIAPSGRAHPQLAEFPLFIWKLRVELHEDDDLGERTTVDLSDLATHQCLVSPFGHMSRAIF